MDKTAESIAQIIKKKGCEIIASMKLNECLPSASYVLYLA